MDGDWSRYSPPEKRNKSLNLVPQPLSVYRSRSDDPVTLHNQDTNLIYRTRARNTSSKDSDDLITAPKAEAELETRCTYDENVGFARQSHLVQSRDRLLYNSDRRERQFSMMEMLNTGPAEEIGAKFLGGGSNIKVSTTPKNDNQTVKKAKSLASLRRRVSPLLTRSSNKKKTREDLLQSMSFPPALQKDRRILSNRSSGPTDDSETYTPTRKGLQKAAGVFTVRSPGSDSTTLSSPSASSGSQNPILPSSSYKASRKAHKSIHDSKLTEEQRKLEKHVIDSFARSPGLPKGCQPRNSPDMSTPISMLENPAVYKEDHCRVKLMDQAHLQDVFGHKPIYDPFNSCRSTMNANRVSQVEEQRRISPSALTSTGRRFRVAPLVIPVVKSPIRNNFDDAWTPSSTRYVSRPRKSDPASLDESHIHPALRQTQEFWDEEAFRKIPYQSIKCLTSESSIIGSTTKSASESAENLSRGKHDWIHSGMFSLADVARKTPQNSNTSDTTEIAISKDRQSWAQKSNYGDQNDGECGIMIRSCANKGNSWSKERTAVTDIMNSDKVDDKPNIFQERTGKEVLISSSNQGVSAARQVKCKIAQNIRMNATACEGQCSAEAKQDHHRCKLTGLADVQQDIAETVDDIRQMDEITYRQQVARKKKAIDMENAARKQKEIEAIQAFKVSLLLVFDQQY